MKSIALSPGLPLTLGSFPRRCVLLGAALLGGLALGPARLPAQDALLSAADYEILQAGGNPAANGKFGMGGAPVSNAYSGAFTGLDGSGQTRTMTFSGSASGNAQYGQLHASANGTVTNTYYNQNNPPYLNSDGTINPAGSPTGFYTYGIASFNDTLQYGGALQSGYQARYIFHLDGTVSGANAAPFLNVTIAGQSQEFTTAQTGELSLDWATMGVPISGQNPQQLLVNFSTQFYLDLSDGNTPDGSTVSGMAQFSDTLTLAGIEVVDANGNPVSGVTINSASGTVYPMAAPEPGTYVLVAFPVLLLFISRWRRRQRAGCPVVA